MIGDAKKKSRSHDQEKDRRREAARINLLGFHARYKSPVDVGGKEADDAHILFRHHPQKDNKEQ